jgi:hypothetical protein
MQSITEQLGPMMLKLSIVAVPAALGPLDNFIAGSWRAAAATEMLEDRDPASGELIAQVPPSGPATASDG